jgi:hypothetical protein
MVTHKGALHEPEEARALCWCRRRAQGTLAREERLPGGRPDRLDAEVGYSGKHGMSGDGAPGPLVARGAHAMGAPARWRCAERPTYAPGWCACQRRGERVGGRSVWCPAVPLRHQAAREAGAAYERITWRPLPHEVRRMGTMRPH